MQIVLALGVSLLAAVGSSQPQPTPIESAQPLTITFVKASFEEALSTIAKVSGVVIEIDQTVDRAVREQPIHDSPVTLREASLLQVVNFLTSERGLSYSVVDGRTIRIFKKA